MQQTMQKILPPPSLPPPPPPPQPPSPTSPSHHYHHHHHHLHRHRMTFLDSASSTMQSPISNQTEISEDERGAKRILKETVDAVVNSFAKHTREFGRGE